MLFFFILDAALVHLIDDNANDDDIENNLIEQLYSIFNDSFFVNVRILPFYVNFHEFPIDPMLETIVEVSQFGKYLTESGGSIGEVILLYLNLFSVVDEGTGERLDGEGDEFIDGEHHPEF